VRLSVLKVAAVVSAAWLMCCAGAAASSHGSIGMSSKDGEWLFTHSAKHATLRPVAGSKELRLTLTGTSPTVRAITRGAGRFDVKTLSDFVRSWTAFGFARTPPNAAIVAPGEASAHNVLIARLSHPNLIRNGVSYIAKPMGRTPKDLSYFKQGADQSLPSQLGKTSVYLDDADDQQAVFSFTFDLTGGWGGTMTFSSPVALEAHLVHGPGNMKFNPPSPYPAWQPADSFTMVVDGGGALINIYMAVNPTGDCLMVNLKLQGLRTFGTIVGGPLDTPIHPGLNIVSQHFSGFCNVEPPGQLSRATRRRWR
jgi:hypothetical protein